eukprot:3630942-Amphidinium_carterae.1
MNDLLHSHRLKKARCVLIIGSAQRDDAERDLLTQLLTRDTLRLVVFFGPSAKLAKTAHEVVETCSTPIQGPIVILPYYYDIKLVEEVEAMKEDRQFPTVPIQEYQRTQRIVLSMWTEFCCEPR